MRILLRDPRFAMFCQLLAPATAGGGFYSDKIVTIRHTDSSFLSRLQGDIYSDDVRLTCAAGILREHWLVCSILADMKADLLCTAKETASSLGIHLKYAAAT